MKRYYETRSEAQRALKSYVQKWIDLPRKEDLRVRKYGKRYVVATEHELWLKRIHELPLKPL